MFTVVLNTRWNAQRIAVLLFVLTVVDALHFSNFSDLHEVIINLFELMCVYLLHVPLPVLTKSTLFSGETSNWYTAGALSTTPGHDCHHPVEVRRHAHTVIMHPYHGILCAHFQ